MPFYRRLLVVMAVFVFMPAFADNRAEEKQQSRLDAACEAAREQKLAPLREKYERECVEDWGRSEAYCERFYRDYGNPTRDGRPALFYDLPACEKAFDFRFRDRRPD